MGLDEVDLSVAGAEYEEALPFAIHDNENTYTSSSTIHEPLHPSVVGGARPMDPEQYRSVMKSMMSVSLSSYYNDGYNISNNSNSNSNLQAPGLASSMMSESSASAMSDFPPPANHHHQSSQAAWGTTSTAGDHIHMLASQHLDAAASLMAGMEGSLAFSRGLSTQQRIFDRPAVEHHARVAVPVTAPYASMGFSQLMENAGDETYPGETTTALPSLPEETVLLPGSTSSADMEQSFHSARSSSFPSNIPTTSSQTVSSDWVPVSSLNNEPSFHQQGSYQPPSLPGSRLGQTINSSTGRLSFVPSYRKAVQARRLDATSFEVSIEIDPRLAIEDVMEVVGNPSYLSLWCESIRSLVITKSSEGARTAAQENRRSSSLRSGSARAEYEGEWIEATATNLVSPPSPSSCLYSTSRAVWNYVGFPTNYGSVSMFVERQRGRVGLTVGPFAGNVTASHTISVEKDARGARILDRVTLSRGMENNDNNELMCGVLDCLESCLLPTLKGYMEQVVSSLVRLRALVETADGRQFEEDVDDDFELIVPAGIVS